MLENLNTSSTPAILLVRLGTDRPRAQHRRKRGTSKVHLLCSLIALLVLPALDAGPVFGQEVKPKGIYEIAKPATTLIVSNFKLDVSVPSTRINVDQLAEEVRKQLRKEGESRTPGSISKALAQTLKGKPTEHFQQALDLRDTEGSYTAMGSGFIASPKGHVITNAHVVKPSSAEIARIIFKKCLKDDMAQFKESMRAKYPELARLTGRDAEAFENALKDSLLVFYKKRAKLKWKGEYSVNIPVTDAQGEVTLKKYIAQGLVAGNPAPGKDVAVLKIEGPRDFPTLKIATDSQLNVGDEIYVIGFPGAATIHPYLSKPSISEATLTKGIISAKKTAPAGFTLLQHDAATAPGNSGGPALDSSGKVIGIHTFGSGGREKVQGLNFVVPASVIQEFLDRVGVRTDKQVNNPARSPHDWTVGS